MVLRPVILPRPRLLKVDGLGSRLASGTICLWDDNDDGFASLGDKGTSPSLDWEVDKMCSVPSAYKLPSLTRPLFNLKLSISGFYGIKLK